MLDELLQYRTDALDALRQPMESGKVTIARVDGVLTMPARFMLLAAFNPCPCGWDRVDGHTCTCEESAKRRYQARLSGPLRDRFDLQVPMQAVAVASSRRRPEPTAMVATRVAAAWCRQLERQGSANAELPPTAFDAEHGFDDGFVGLLEQRGRGLGLSPRRLHRAARVARTIADLAVSATVEPDHLDEALTHRPMELAA